MLQSVRAAATAAALFLSPRRRTLHARPAPPKLRTLGPADAAAAFAPADAIAEALSLWTTSMTRQCLVAAQYGSAPSPARFGRLMRLSTASASHASKAPASGVAALFDRLRAAGFVVADEATAAHLAAQPRRGGAVVRVLQQTPSRSRRAAWADEDARIAA